MNTNNRFTIKSVYTSAKFARTFIAFLHSKKNQHSMLAINFQKIHTHKKENINCITLLLRMR